MRRDAGRADHPVPGGGRGGGGSHGDRRLRQVAKDGAVAALQASRPGQAKVSAAEASELAKLRAEVDRPRGGGDRPGCRAGGHAGKIELRLSDPIPARVDGAAKAGLLRASDMLEKHSSSPRT